MPLVNAAKEQILMDWKIQLDAHGNSQMIFMKAAVRVTSL